MKTIAARKKSFKIKPVPTIVAGLLVSLSAFLVYQSLGGNLRYPPNTTIVRAQGEYAYKNETNIFQTQFKFSPTDPNSVVFANDLGQISFYTPAEQIFGTINSENEPVAVGSSLTYPDIYQGLDLKYTISSSRLLEEFIVKDRETADKVTRIEQRVNTTSSYTENNDKSITFSNGDQATFILPAPIMYEVGNSDHVSGGLFYEIKKESDYLVITKVITAEGRAWLSDESRQFPVAIDLVIDNVDSTDNWISSDPTYSTASTDSSIKHEGANSIKIATTADSTTPDIDLFEFGTDHAARTTATRSAITATGGTITNVNGYTVHTFTASGTFTVTSGSGNVEVLVVAGGGGGGSDMGGGGGGGGVVSNTAYTVPSVLPGAITVTVGAGGAGAPAGINQARGSSGGNSVFGSITAIGGGGGGSEYNNNNSPAAAGGSGGGASAGNSKSGGAGTTGQGFAGGNSGGVWYSGGGGGAGGPGLVYPGDGGPGLPSDINGTLLYWGAGGGGAGYSMISGNGGIGGGGGGAPKTTTAGIVAGLGGLRGLNIGTDGTAGALASQTNKPGGDAGANTGSGGGGGSHYNATNAGGDGGSGIVIVRYPTAGYLQPGYISNGQGIVATGGEITYSGGYKIHTFKRSEAFTVKSGSGDVEFLLVAGGGGGGSDMGGGGGGGGVISNSAYAVTQGSISATVGAGGAGAAAGISQARGSNGGSTSFGYPGNVYTAIGGGGGGSEYNNNNSPAGSGGSGGGASAGTGKTGGTGTNGQGFAGGASGGVWYAGGGGGAGGVGTVNPGNGGIGFLSSINGTSLRYGGGGGGAGYSGIAGNGGAGGGGGGAPMVSGGGLGGGSALNAGYNAAAGTLASQTNKPGGDGGDNTGGGGGGGSHYNATNAGGAGGSGVIIVRYPIPSLEAFSSAGLVATGGTISTVGGNTIHRFTSSGTFNVTSGSTYAQLLTVGGGGGGGANMGGGGGGGGVIYNGSYPITAGGYLVSIGAGGAGATAGIETGPGLSGTTSYFYDQVSRGGGGGATNYNTNTSPAQDGGSGGGNASYLSLYPGRGTVGQGNSGGQGTGQYYPGGGGGAGAAGGVNPGNGGAGYLTSISGASLYYGGGGGGAGYSGIAGNGGVGGGGGGAPMVSGGGLGGGSALNSGANATAGTLGTQTNVPGGAAGANTGGGGGGGAHYNATNAGGAGGSGVVIVSYPTPTTVKSEGTYALKVVAQATTSLSKTLTKTLTTPINLANKSSVTFDIRASRTGSNIKVGLHDAGGTITEIVPNITAANTFQTASFDLSAVSNVNKDAIDQIIITVVNADALNTFYLDNMMTNYFTIGDTITKTTSATDLSTAANLTFWVRSNVAGSFARFQFGESNSSEQTFPITINQINTWEQKVWDISSIPAGSRNAVTKFAFAFTSDTSGAEFYFDDIQTNNLFAPSIGEANALSDTSIRWEFNDNSAVETGFKIFDSNDTLKVTCASTNIGHCDETGLTPNTQYTRKIGTYNADATTINTNTISAYTLAATPSAPSMSNRASTSVQVNPEPGTNPAGTMMAIYKEVGSTCDGTGGSYLAANGSENGTVPVWQNDSTWSTVTATGLNAETTYSFCVKARNADGVQTGFSPSASFENQGYVPISGGYVYTGTANKNTNTFVNRYIDGNNPSRYVIAIDNGGSPNNAVFEAKSGLLTINATDTLAVGSLSLTGGSIAIAAGGEIKIGQSTWIVDQDNDGYSADGKIYVGTQPSNGKRKSLVTTLAVSDCDDNDYKPDNVCCAIATRYQDLDGDGQGNASVSISACVTAGYVNNSTDCYDANPATTNAELAYVGSATCGTTHRGDGSFDYNCSGGNANCGANYYPTITHQSCDFACGQNNANCCANGSATVILSTAPTQACGVAGRQRAAGAAFGHSNCGGPCAPVPVGYSLGAAGTQGCN
jgi:hypothetical protein